MTHKIEAADFDFSGQRVLVTGAAGGIGSVMARSFAAHGAELIIADRNEPALRTLADELPGASSIGFDQSSPADIDALVSAAGPVDVLLNNAGILRVAPVIEMSQADIVALININFTGAVLVARGVARAMAERRRGVIINTSSQLAFSGAAAKAVYGATKAAIRHFTASLAAELAPVNVRVAAIAPGRTLSPMTAPYLNDANAREEGLLHIPSGRYGDTAEMGKLALFLASPLASYVVGETFVADGGYVTV